MIAAPSLMHQFALNCTLTQSIKRKRERVAINNYNYTHQSAAQAIKKNIMNCAETIAQLRKELEKKKSDLIKLRRIKRSAVRSNIVLHREIEKLKNKEGAAATAAPRSGRSGRAGNTEMVMSHAIEALYENMTECQICYNETPMYRMVFFSTCCHTLCLNCYVYNPSKKCPFDNVPFRNVFVFIRKGNLYNITVLECWKPRALGVTFQ